MKQLIIGKRCYFLALVILTILLFSPSLVLSKKTPPKPSQAIRITSDKLEAMDQKGKVVFSGNVIARRGNLTIYADRLEVYYTSTSSKKGKKKLKKIVATGHLKIVQGKRRATAKKAIYLKPQEKILLIKDATVWDGPNSVTGDRITLFINENRSIVESSGKKRVEAVVYSEGD